MSAKRTIFHFPSFQFQSQNDLRFETFEPLFRRDAEFQLKLVIWRNAFLTFVILLLIYVSQTNAYIL